MIDIYIYVMADLTNYTDTLFSQRSLGGGRGHGDQAANHRNDEAAE